MVNTKFFTISDGKKEVKVSKEGHGLMMMTWKPDPVPDEQCFAAIKASLDSVPDGVKMILNSGEFYGIDPPTANLEMIARFFKQFPEYKEKAFLSVKGGAEPDKLLFNSSPENLKRSVNKILEKLGGYKSLDLFECARVDHNYPLEQTIQVLAGFVEEGKFDFVGMSECSAQTLKTAHGVHPIAAVEIEISPWSYEDETKSVIQTTKELGIAVVGYSPLGRGFLAGSITKVEDMHPNDWRRNLTRFKQENLDKNAILRGELEKIATEKGITVAQLCIAWVCHLGEHVIPIPGSSSANRTTENLKALDVTLDSSDLKKIQEILDKNPVEGDRYYGLTDRQMHLWG